MVSETELDESIPMGQFNPIQDGSFQDCSRIGGAKSPRLSKICHAYPTVMKLGTVILHLKPKKDPKIYKSRDTHPEFC